MTVKDSPSFLTLQSVIGYVKELCLSYQNLISVGDFGRFRTAINNFQSSKKTLEDEMKEYSGKYTSQGLSVVNDLLPLIVIDSDTEKIVNKINDFTIKRPLPLAPRTVSSNYLELSDFGFYCKVMEIGSTTNNNTILETIFDILFVDYILNNVISFYTKCKTITTKLKTYNPRFGLKSTFLEPRTQNPMLTGLLSSFTHLEIRRDELDKFAKYDYDSDIQEDIDNLLQTKQTFDLIKEDEMAIVNFLTNKFKDDVQGLIQRLDGTIASTKEQTLNYMADKFSYTENTVIDQIFYLPGLVKTYLESTDLRYIVSGPTPTLKIITDKDFRNLSTFISYKYKGATDDISFKIESLTNSIVEADFPTKNNLDALPKLKTLVNTIKFLPKTAINLDIFNIKSNASKIDSEMQRILEQLLDSKETSLGVYFNIAFSVWMAVSIILSTSSVTSMYNSQPFQALPSNLQNVKDLRDTIIAGICLGAFFQNLVTLILSFASFTIINEFINSIYAARTTVIVPDSVRKKYKYMRNFLWGMIGLGIVSFFAASFVLVISYGSLMVTIPSQYDTFAKILTGSSAVGGVLLMLTLVLGVIIKYYSLSRFRQ